MFFVLRAATGRLRCCLIRLHGPPALWGVSDPLQLAAALLQRTYLAPQTPSLLMGRLLCTFSPQRGVVKRGQLGVIVRPPPELDTPIVMHPGSCCAAAAAGRDCLVGRPVDGPPSCPGLTLVAPVCQLLHHVNCFCHLALAIAMPAGLPLTGPLGEARQ